MSRIAQTPDPHRRPPRPRRQRNVTVTLGDDAFAAVVAEARRLQTSVSGVVRRALVAAGVLPEVSQ